MAEPKHVKTRIINKHATAAVWEQTDFTPLQGEIVIYDPGYDDTDKKTYSYERMKIGDGSQTIQELPFVNEVESLTNIEIDECLGIPNGKYIIKAPESFNFTVDGAEYNPDEEYDSEHIELLALDVPSEIEYFSTTVTDNVTGLPADYDTMGEGRNVILYTMPDNGVTVCFKNKYDYMTTANITGEFLDVTVNNQTEGISGPSTTNCPFNVGDVLIVHAPHDSLLASEIIVQVEYGEVILDAEYIGGYEWKFTAPASDVNIVITV